MPPPDDDTRRIAYTGEPVRHLSAAMDDGVDGCGYLHRSTLDTCEWGPWEPTCGPIAVDRENFGWRPKRDGT